MKHETQPGYIPHIGPVCPTKPIRQHRKSQVDKIKEAVGSVREHAAEFIKSLVSYKADAILLTGKERHSGEPLCVFYFGVGENLAYLVGLLYTEHEAAILAADVNPWRVGAWCKKFQAGADVVLLDLPWPVCRIKQNDSFLTLAPWVNMVIPIGETWEAVVERWNRDVKGNDLRRIRKHQLNYRKKDSEQDFRDFYHTHYLPYVTTRFGEAMFIEPEEKVVSVHEYGEIIEILREDTVIAAGILIDNNGSLESLWLGIPADLEPPMYDGAFSALYYYAVRIAYDSGCRQVDCLTNRPTLNDGVLRYKRKWGAMFSGCDAMDGLISLKPMREHPAVMAFLRHNPLISLVDGGLVAKLLLDEPELSVERVLETFDGYYTEGLRSLRLYSLHGFAPAVDDAMRERKLPVQLFDLHGVENPLQVYCRA